MDEALKPVVNARKGFCQDMKLKEGPSMIIRQVLEEVLGQSLLWSYELLDHHLPVAKLGATLFLLPTRQILLWYKKDLEESSAMSHW